VGLADDLREAGTPSSSVSRIAELSRHQDRRVRALAASHQALPQSAFGELASDPDPAVRAALAWSHSLDHALCLPLLRDQSRRVRRAVLRRQDLPFDALRQLVESGRATEAVLDRMRTFLSDPAVAEPLLNQPRWAYFAADGAFRHEFVAALLARKQQQWIIGRLAARGTFDDRTALMLAKHDDRAVQESVAGRIDLSTAAQRRIALRGGVWARATLIRRRPNDRVLKWCGRLGTHRVLRRGRAEVAERRFALAWLATSRHWDVKAAAASNPALGRRTQRRLAGSGSSAVGAALARRKDLSTQSIETLVKLHLLVRLELAANPLLPLSAVERLAVDADPFVAGVANWRAPWPNVDELLRDPATPAWVLRGVAISDRASNDERDRILTWLALGGGNGDPTFDPITCTGSPSSTGVVGPDAYRLDPKWDDPQYYRASPLWRTRVLAGQGRASLSHEVVSYLATDPHPAVRRVAAGYRSLPSLRELRFDVNASVSTQALTTMQSTVKPKLPPREYARVLGRRFAVPIVIAAFVGLSAAGPDTNNDGDFRAPLPAVPGLATSLGTWDVDPLRPITEVQVEAFAQEPWSVPVCVTGSGAEIWVLTGFGPGELDGYVKVAVSKTTRDVWVYPFVLDQTSGSPEEAARKVSVMDDWIIALGFATHRQSGHVRVEIREAPNSAEPITTYRVKIPFGPGAGEPTAYGGCE
jgi:hypothetical protein